MTRHLPHILGIVNITEDSFSDGGQFLTTEAALAHAHRLVTAGADAVDIGAASSHPDAKPVPVAEEIRRLAPVIDALHEAGVRVSVDTHQPEVQRFALARNVAYLNDIRGFPDPDVWPALAPAACDLILMHSIQRTGQATREYTTPAEVLAGMTAFFAARLAALEGAGVRRERIILDPGMGYFLGANPETSLLALQRIPALRSQFGCRVLVCVSRKSFLGSVTGRAVSERGPASLAAELYAARAGVDIIRTHDVQALHDALAMTRALDANLPETAEVV